MIRETRWDRKQLLSLGGICSQSGGLHIRKARGLELPMQRPIEDTGFSFSALKNEYKHPYF